jgi:hypothetical protein
LAIATVFVLLSGSYAKANAMRSSLSADESTWFLDMSRFAQSAHAALTCGECHGTMTEAGRRHPDEMRPGFLKRSATRTYDYSRCRKCHEIAYTRYQAGGHAKARQEEKIKSKKTKEDAGEKRTAPTCGDCHASHYVRSGLSRIDVGRRMIDVCGECHAAHTSSYIDNIHGKLGVDLGNAKAAFCTDCHGAHAVESLEKQQSALTVCQRCHHKAEEAFTGIVIHASLQSISAVETEKNRSILWIQRVRWMAVAVVTLSLAFFGVHSFLWLLREIHEKLRKR